MNSRAFETKIEDENSSQHQSELYRDSSYIHLDNMTLHERLNRSDCLINLIDEIHLAKYCEHQQIYGVDR